MFQEELYREISMSYYELVEYLLDKYGAAQYDYFCNDNCKSQPKKLKRTRDLGGCAEGHTGGTTQTTPGYRTHGMQSTGYHSHTGEPQSDMTPRTT